MTDQETVRFFKAEFSQSRNDLHWKIWTPEDGFIYWTGYDDAYWWDRVSLADHARTRVGEKTGDTYVIDFDTQRVTVVSAT